MTLPLFPSSELPHTCHARGCNVSVSPHMLMCIVHWRRVTKRIQRAVWATYRPGQCDDRNPSEAWHQAADAAIGYVARLENKPVRLCEDEALQAFGCQWAEKLRMFVVK